MSSDTILANSLKPNTPSLTADQIKDDYLESLKLASLFAYKIWQNK